MKRPDWMTWPWLIKTLIEGLLMGLLMGLVWGILGVLK